MTVEDQVLTLLGVHGVSVGADLGPVDRLLAIKSAVESSNVVPPALFRAANTDLLGRTPEDKVQVDMWLTYLRSTSLNAETLGSLNRVLSGRSFLVGQALSVADVDLYAHLLANLDVLSVESTVHVCRWFEHVQHVLGVPEKKLFWVRAAAPFLIPLPELDKPQAQTEQAPAEQSTQAAVSAAAPAAQPEAKAAAEAPSASAPKKDKKAAKADAKPEEEGKKEAAKPSAKAEEAADLSPGLLDIRVGRVVRCWAHEGSEKLLCEEIDLGEASGTRNIASGIRLFYAPEQVQGRLVLVLANLKERSVAGFRSQGMVLCAVTGDHASVALLEPPADAKVGDRVQFRGLPSCEPATAAQLAKKKLLEALAPGLRTDDQGVAHWKEAAFVVGDGVCKAPLINATVS